ncbi:FMN-binding negative transcriptional regulator [Mucilaginibacter gynuensis]|uniref:FMN-binding negative transcriptional regulator n=1 Tax=Mucilaginibacter gynuensis TaxID=1302236 RepID=A0ABP8FQC2_9SPHI
MYTPANNRIDNLNEAVMFMQRYSFATIINVIDGKPEATHLPFLIEQRDGKITLSSHFAKANPQAKAIDGSEVLVIFTEPHAYISPSHYEKETNVPTWNYLAVHAYGKAKELAEVADKFRLLAHTINQYEAAYMQQWESLPDIYRDGLIKGITAFEIEVTNLQAKKKLSQNKTELERNNIINALKNSADTNERDIAAYMQALDKK